MKEADPMLVEYREALQARGYARRMAQDYHAQVRRLAAWSAGRDLTEETLRAYRDHLKATSARCTVRQALAALSLFVAFLGRSGRLECLPAVPAALEVGESRQGRRGGNTPAAPT